MWSPPFSPMRTASAWCMNTGRLPPDDRLEAFYGAVIARNL